MSDYRLIHGDCLEVLPTLAAGSVDAVVTDPPYSAATHNGARSKGNGEDRRGHNPIAFAHQDGFLTRTALALALPARWCVVFIDWHHALPLKQEPPNGLEFIRLGVWSKLNPMPQLTGDRPAQGWEAIALLHPPGKKRWNGGGGPALWHHGTTRYGYFGPSNHPTEKPLGLMAKLIEQFTDKGETVLDPFMGSGTTGVACLQTGRKFIGIEKDRAYFEIARKRLREVEKERIAEAVA